MGRKRQFSDEERRRRAREAHKRWTQKHPDRYVTKYTADNRWKKYGITVEEYRKIMSLGCGICGSTDRLCVDHDHKTGRVRGALCKKHNTALGLFDDDPDVLRKAIRWVEERH